MFARLFSMTMSLEVTDQWCVSLWKWWSMFFSPPDNISWPALDNWRLGPQCYYPASVSHFSLTISPAAAVSSGWSGRVRIGATCQSILAMSYLRRDGLGCSLTGLTLIRFLVERSPAGLLSLYLADMKAPDARWCFLGIGAPVWCIFIHIHTFYIDPAYKYIQIAAPSQNTCLHLHTALREGDCQIEAHQTHTPSEPDQSYVK